MGLDGGVKTKWASETCQSQSSRIEYELIVRSDHTWILNDSFDAVAVAVAVVIDVVLMMLMLFIPMSR